jgi:hypothetical protein
MRTKHTDPYRGFRIMLTTGALALPIAILIACGVYMVMAQH